MKMPPRGREDSPPQAEYTKTTGKKNNIFPQKNGQGPSLLFTYLGEPALAKNGLAERGYPTQNRSKMNKTQQEITVLRGDSDAGVLNGRPKIDKKKTTICF